MSTSTPSSSNPQPATLIISIPAANKALISEIQRELSTITTVTQAPPSRDINDVKFVIDLVGATVGIGGGVAGILAYIRSLKPQAAQPNTYIVIVNNLGKKVELDTADEDLLKELLGLG